MSQPAAASPPPSPVPLGYESPEAISSRALVAWMFRFLKPVKHLAAVCVALVVLNVFIEIQTVRQMGHAITALQRVAGNSSHDGFWRWLTGDDAAVRSLRHVMIAWSAYMVAFLVLRFVREVMNSKFSMDGVYYIREAIYDKLQRVGLSFHDSVSSGQLINRALSDLQNVRQFVQQSMMQVVDILAAVPSFLLLMFFINPWLSLLALVPLPIWTIYILRFSNRVQPAAKLSMESEDRNVSIITENIAGVHVVKAFATERGEVEKFNDNADTFKARVLARIRMWANFHPVIRGVASASNLSLFLLAGVLIILSKGTKVSVGDLVALGTAMSQLLARLQGVAQINEQYQNAIVSARRLYEVLAAPTTVPEEANAKHLPAGAAGEVIFEDVTFAYGATSTTANPTVPLANEPPGKDVLRGVSFRAPGGSVVAIVGPTGAGKSTLVNLIARFYDPKSGRVIIDGLDIRDVSLGSLRTQVSFVFQETYLFSDTVTANVAYGRPGITRGDVEAATRLAQAHDFIEALPKGYDTLLGERGTNLSGGQRQRLAIARAIVTNPRILILDDATAAVDSETEDLIRRGMQFVMAGRTTFIIAHRISTVKRANLVLVVENGRITQQGTHDELMRRDGHYREVARVQLSHDDAFDAPDGESPSHVKRLRDEKTLGAVTATAAGRGNASETDG